MGENITGGYHIFDFCERIKLCNTTNRRGKGLRLIAYIDRELPDVTVYWLVVHED